MKRYKKRKKTLFEIVSFAIYFLVSLPKTIFFNFKCLPIKQALHLPVLIGYNVALIETSGIVKIHGSTIPFMIRIGHGGSKAIPTQKSLMRIRSNGKIIFTGKARLSAGTVFDVGGRLEIGNNFSSNRNCFFHCDNEITIGDNVLLGWNVHLFDNDGGHVILHNGKEKVGFTSPKILVGNHVWLCSYSHLLKGAQISDGSILGYNSILLKAIKEENVLCVGIPATIKQKNIEWSL